MFKRLIDKIKRRSHYEIVYFQETGEYPKYGALPILEKCREISEQGRVPKGRPSPSSLPKVRTDRTMPKCKPPKAEGELHAAFVLRRLNEALGDKSSPHKLASFVLCFHDTLKESLELMIKNEKPSGYIISEHELSATGLNEVKTRLHSKAGGYKPTQRPPAGAKPPGSE